MGINSSVKNGLLIEGCAIFSGRNRKTVPGCLAFCSPAIRQTCYDDTAVLSCFGICDIDLPRLISDDEPDNGLQR